MEVKKEKHISSKPSKVHHIEKIPSGPIVEAALYLPIYFSPSFSFRLFEYQVSHTNNAT